MTLNVLLKIVTAHGGLRASLAGLIWLALVITSHATTIKSLAFPELVNRSDYVVRAVVKSVRSELTVLPDGRKIHTHVELDVTDAIAGNPPSPLVLRLLGGKVGELEMVLQGAPTFQVGEEHILFIKGNGRMAYPLVGMMHGQFPIRRDEATARSYVTRSNGLPLQDTTEVSQAMTDGAVAPQHAQARRDEALSPEQFIQQIKGVSKHPSQRALR